MNFDADIELKEDYAFVVADRDGQLWGTEKGLYSHDTRYLSMYRWELGERFERLLGVSSDGRSYATHHALMNGDKQIVAVRRYLEVSATGFDETLRVENTDFERRTAWLSLHTQADFTDIFAVRGLFEHGTRHQIQVDHTERGLRYRYDAADGASSGVEIALEPQPDVKEQERFGFRLELEPGEVRTLRSRVRLEHSLAPTMHNPETGRDTGGKAAAEAERETGGATTGASGGNAARLSYDEWRASFDALRPHTEGRLEESVLRQALDDLRALLLFTPKGPVPAAGIPWYGAVFGRDSLIAAYMLLPHGSDVALATLRYLAAYQGTRYDAFRGEEPGKILHEMRFGELSRIGATPHSPYYGSIDATPLFIVLLHELFVATEDSGPIVELREHWEAALDWMQTSGDADGDGFLEYGARSQAGTLVPQSWKDSADSMSHNDGSLACGPIAPSEFQGYAYRAYRAASRFYGLLGDAERSAYWEREAWRLKERFHEAFWHESLGMYAMALDGGKQPLRVMNSNAGHLLVTGIAKDEVLPTLVDALFSEAMWSGWGIRSLGSGERRYNPVSYHNGSVWPHDTAFIAAGLERYGYHGEAVRLRDALFALGESQSDKRVPELVAGYPREPEAPPVAYPVACRPQAWGAATVPYLLYRLPGG